MPERDSASVDSPSQTIPTSLPRRLDAIRSFQEQGGRVAAVLPIHYPRALLRAFGFLPVEVWGPPNVDPAEGAAHLQPYVCSIVRNALSFLQTADAALADLILVPHACDSLQGLGSLLIDFVRPRQPVFPFYLPRGRRESDLCFLVDELRGLYGRLQTLTGQAPGRAELLGCVRREEAADELLAQLHERRRALPLTLLEFYRLVRAREYLPAEEFSGLAQAALAQAAASRPPDGVPILLSGIVPEPMSLFEALPRLGAYVGADDLACCGRRLYPAGRSLDPFRRMAESLLAAPPDSTRGDPVQARLSHLLRLARQSDAKGAVFYDVKFCEPELFYLPQLRKALQEAGIPALAVEVDLNEPLSQQLLTRLEAFVEMIG